MPSTFGLQDAIDLIRNTDEDELMGLLFHEQLVGFMNELNRKGTDIMTDLLGKDKARAAHRLALISSEMILIQNCSDNPWKMQEIQYLFQSELFDMAILMAMKFTLGLSVLEELH